jgi:2'-5' RNA ligase
MKRETSKGAAVKNTSAESGSPHPDSSPIPNAQHLTPSSSFIPHPSALIPSTSRVFCAVPLPIEIRERAVEHIAQLRQAAPNVRAGWERVEKMHITLKFLGEIEASGVASLSESTERAASAWRPFKLSITGAGAFPTPRNPRVLWLGIADQSSELARLQKYLEDECAAADFKRDTRAFHPHLTIARLRTPQGAHRLAKLHQELGFAQMEFTVNEIVVVRSELAPGGSRYTDVSRHALSV